MDRYFIPDKGHLPLRLEDLRQWYDNLLFEISGGGYSDKEIALFKDKHNYYGKYLSEDTREFFLNHFGRNLARAVNFFLDGREDVKYLEVGSGCGHQLLLMAFLGADVVGCDIRQDICDFVKRRKGLYEEITEHKLNTSIICEDVFNVNWDKFSRFDAVNFLFSFNDVVAGHKPIEFIAGLIKHGGRLVIQDTNQSNYYNRIFRRRDSMLPQQVAKALERYNFKIHSLQGGSAVPPIFWNILPRSVIASIDQILCRSLFMSPSYHLMAEKL